MKFDVEDEEDNDLLSSWSVLSFCRRLRLNSFNFRGVIRKKKEGTGPAKPEKEKFELATWISFYLSAAILEARRKCPFILAFKLRAGSRLHYFLWWIRRKGGARVCTSPSNYISGWSPVIFFHFAMIRLF